MPAFTITVTSTATSIRELVQTAAGAAFNPGTRKQNINAMHFQVQSQGIRYCPDGNTPTASTGIRYTAAAEVAPVISSPNLLDLLLISSTGVNSTVTIFLGESD